MIAWKKKKMTSKRRQATATVKAPAAPAAPQLAAEWVEIEKLVPWVKNPRKNDAAAEGVAKLIVRLGFGAPLVARRENYEISAGHTRVKACLLLRRRWKVATKKQRDEWRSSADREVRWHSEAISIAEGGPVPVRLKDWDEYDSHLYAIGDNKSNEFAEWELQVVAEELANYSLADAAVAGFSQADLEAMVSTMVEDGGRPDDDETGEESATDVVIAVGKYRVKLPRARWEKMEQNLRDAAGFDRQAIIDEILRRLSA